MSDSNHDSAELETVTEVAEGEETASTTEEAETNTSEDEESTNRTAEEAKEEQLKAHLAKIVAGKSALEDSPAWMQEDLKKRLPTKAEDLDALVEAKLDARLKAREEEALYENMKTTLNERNLSDEEKAQVKSEFDDFVALGLTKAKALEKAVKIALPDAEEQMIAERKKAMQLPNAGGYTDGSEHNTWDNMDNLKDDQIVDLALGETHGVYGY